MVRHPFFENGAADAHALSDRTNAFFTSFPCPSHLTWPPLTRCGGAYLAKNVQPDLPKVTRVGKGKNMLVSIATYSPFGIFYLHG